jgi:hypothetical protein
LISKRIIQTRDVVWLGKDYNYWRKNKAPSNDKNKEDEIGDSMEAYVILTSKSYDKNILP